MTTPDAVVVGAGPNGLAAAVTLARAGLQVTLFERQSTVGGGARTAELNLSGFLHDVCSAVHPMAFASKFFQAFELSERIPFITPDISYAHPLDGGRAGLAHLDLERTVDDLGADGAAWRRLFAPMIERDSDVQEFTGDALVRIPRHPFTAARFGLRVLEQGGPLWNGRWRGDVAPALLSGVMAHAIQPMPSLGSAAAGIALAIHAHGRGWPIPVGGSQRIVDELAADLIAYGGTIVTDYEVTSLRELPPAKLTMLDVTPKALLALAGNRLPERYAAQLRRFRYGNAATKVDFALSGPVPWANADVAHAGTIHVGGSRADIARAEGDVARGQHAERPYVLVAQPSQFDDTRAPAGQQSLWTYAHVPAGSTVDQTEAITAQIERFAPGFRDTILASSSRTALDLERYDPNYVLGDIASGDGTFAQLVARPVVSPHPWRTPVKGLYLCSSSTPPGPGVHGLAGWNAAKSALRHDFGLADAPSLGRKN